MHLSIVIALVGSLLSFVATSASALPNLPATLTCGSGTYTIAVIDGETVAYGGGNCTGSVEIPEGVTVIGNSAFWSAQITAITLPNSLQRIDASGIRSTDITSLFIPANVTSLGELAVASYGITSLTIAPSSQLTTIGPSAFQGLDITSISIPSSVTSMYANALETFGSLTTIRFLGNAPTILGGDPNINGGGLTGLLENTAIAVSPTATGFSASSWSSAPIVRPPAAPESLVGTIGPGQVSIAFTPGAINGGEITNYKYSIDNGATFTALSPADSISPIVISGLTQTQYVIRIKAVNAAGDGEPSTNSVTVTPDPPAVISVQAIGGVTPPFKGSIPVTTVTAANGYTGTVSWSGSPTRFAAATSYTATISLSAGPGYTFSGVAANFFRVAGATSVSNSANSGTITAIFPATSAARCYVVIDRELTEGSACSGAVVIEEGITTIGEYAFQESSATSVYISGDVTEILTGAFSEMLNLREITVSNINAEYSSESGVLFNGEKTILIKYPSSKPDPTYEVPASVETFLNSAFADLDGLEILTIPESVTLINTYSFSNAKSLQEINVAPLNQTYGSIAGVLTTNDNKNLFLYPISKPGTTYTVPSSIETINAYSFSYVLNLMSLVIPDTVLTISTDGVFANPALTSVVIGDGVTQIQIDTFRSNPVLASVEIGNGVTDINAGAFQTLDSLTSVTFGDNVRTIGYQAFVGTSLVEVVLPSSVRTIEYYAFQNMRSLTSISFGNGVETIGEFAFQGASLATLDIPASVIEIGDGAFSLNRKLRRVTLNACNDATSGLRISNHFEGSTNLNSIVYSGPTCDFGPTNVVSTAPEEGIISIPSIIFPATKYGRSSSRTVTVKNVGTGTFAPFGPIGLATTELQDYTYTSTCGSTLLANVTCTITVTFTPILANVNEFNGDPTGILNWNGYSADTPIQQLLIGNIDEDGGTRTISVSTGANGSISPTTSSDVADGTNATYTITPDSGYQIDVVTVDSASVAISTLTRVSGETKSFTFLGVNSDHTISATFRRISSVPEPIIVAPSPVPYLRSLTAPKLNLKDGILICTAGTYNSGFTLNGVIQGSATALFSPTNYTYNLFLNGQVQTSLGVTTTSTSASWNLTGTTPGSVYSCSVTVTNNSVTSIDKSTDNTSGVSTALATQTKAISDADVTYKAALKTNTLAYPKALRDNRAQWSKEIAAIRANYYLTLDRIKANGGSKIVTDATTAYKVMVAAKAKSNADYAASKPAAIATKNAADKAALDAKTSAIAKAKSVYGTFIESIGYGVLVL